jgi:hypothetical protein
MSIMEKEDLELRIIKLIGVLEYLYSIEQFPAYNQLKQLYFSLYERIYEKNKFDEIKEIEFEVIQSSFRIFLEAPPKDKILGKYILDRMQEIYEIQNKLR